MYIYGVPKKYSIGDARAHLPAIVDQAEAGRQIELTRRGKPVAVVVSLRELEHLRGGRVGFNEAFERFLVKHPSSTVGIDEKFFRSLRPRGPGRKVSL